MAISGGCVIVGGMKYQWILFDADNTLFDYDAAELGALSSTFEELGRPLTPERKRLISYVTLTGRFTLFP